MKYLAIIAVLLIAAVARAQDAPPAPIQVENGVAWIGFSNDVQANLIIVTLNRGDCEIVGRYAIDPNEAQQGIQVPRPTDDEKCLLRLGDAVRLLRYRDGVYIDTLGPYTQRGRVLLPMVRG